MRALELLSCIGCSPEGAEHDVRDAAKLQEDIKPFIAAAPAEPCYCDRMGIGVPGVSCGDCPRDYKPAPAVPLADEQFADMVAEASLAVDLAANPLKLLAFAREVLKAHGIGGGGK